MAPRRSEGVGTGTADGRGMHAFTCHWEPSVWWGCFRADGEQGQLAWEWAGRPVPGAVNMPGTRAGALTDALSARLRWEGGKEGGTHARARF